MNGLEPDPELIKIRDKYKGSHAIRRAIPSVCDKCNEDYPSKTALDAHKREIHPIEPVFNDTVRERFLVQLRKGELPHKTARKLGISPETVKRAMRIDPSFADAVVLAEEEGAEDIEANLREAALAKEPWAVTKWLSKRSATRWSDDKTVNVNVSGTITHQAGVLPHEQDILELQRTARERARLSGRQLSPVNENIIDAEVVE